MRVDRKGVVCSIHTQNNLVNVMEFLNCQEPEEASEFISRVKNKVKVCEFIVMSATAE